MTGRGKQAAAGAAAILTVLTVVEFGATIAIAAGTVITGAILLHRRSEGSE